MRRALARAAAVLVTAAVGVLTLAVAPAQAKGDTSTVINFARAQVGKPYLLGASGPNSWDCSSLVQAAYRTAGVELPRVTTEQIGAAGWVSLNSLQPGDLVFKAGSEAKAPGHVGLYAGNGQVIEAKGAAWGTIVAPLAAWNAAAAIRPGTPGVNEYIDQAAVRTGVPRDLLRAQIWQESGFNPLAGSYAGAKGIAQFIDSTWATRGEDGDGDGKKNVYDPADAIPAQADMMAAEIRRYGGSVPLALAAYNAGDGAVAKFGGIPPESYSHGQTFRYVVAILKSADLPSDHIDLHPAPAPAPPIAQQVVTAAVSVVAVPSLPTTATDWVHDTTIATIFLVLLYLALRKLAPEMVVAWKARARTTARRAVRKAATPPRRPAGKPTAAWWARMFAASAVQTAERRAQRAARVRNGSVYRRTRIKVEPRRRPQGEYRRTANPTGYRRPTATPTASKPIFAAAAAWAAEAGRSLAVWLWSLRSDTASPTATAEPSAAPNATGPQGGRPVAVPPQPTSATGASPTATPPRPAPPAARSTTMDMPFNSKWRDRLDPGFEQMTNVRDGLTTVEFDDSWTTAALIEWGHDLLGELSQMFKEIADKVGLRDFDESVPGAIVDAAENADKAANDLLVAAVFLKTKHEALFRLKASKGVDPIAS